MLARRRLVENVEQAPGDVAADDHHGVDDQVDRVAALAEEGGHGVDEERHVVGDDLDDGVARRPAVLVDRRCEHAHRARALRPVRRLGPLRQRGARDVDGVATEDVLGRHVTVVALEERGVGVGGVSALAGLDRACDEVGLGLLEAVRRHAHGRCHCVSPSSRVRPYALVRLSCEPTEPSPVHVGVAVVGRGDEGLLDRPRARSSGSGSAPSPALSLVPDARAPPNGCWPTTAPVGLSLT